MEETKRHCATCACEKKNNADDDRSWRKIYSIMRNDTTREEFRLAVLKFMVYHSLSDHELSLKTGICRDTLRRFLHGASKRLRITTINKLVQFIELTMNTDK